MIILPETAADRDAIRKVNDEAFGGPLEAKLQPEVLRALRLCPADAVGIAPPTEAHGPQYLMIRPLARYDLAFRGSAIYPPETFGIAY